MVAKSSFVQMFAKSPIEPMQQHVEKSHRCAMELIPFFEAALAKDWKTAEEIQQRIAKLEHEANELKRNIRSDLPRSLFLPVSRTDLLNLLRMQDRIANTAKDIAGTMLGREMEIPALIATQMQAYVKCALSVTAQAVKAVNELDELVTTGFRGREAKTVEKMINHLDALEHVGRA